MRKYRGIRYKIQRRKNRSFGTLFIVQYYVEGRGFSKESYSKSTAKALAFSDIDAYKMS